MKGLLTALLALVVLGGMGQSWTPRLPVGLDSARAVTCHQGNPAHGTLLPQNPFSVGAVDYSLPSENNISEISLLGAVSGGMGAGTSTRGLGQAAVAVQWKRFLGQRGVASATVGGMAEALPSYLDQLVRSTEILPGVGRVNRQGDVVIAPWTTGYLGWNLGQHFYAEAGHGKHFWGDGYRSLILSHNTAPYSYLRFETTGWHLKYVNLWAYMREYNLDGNGQTEGKYFAAHALDWNVSNYFSLGFYEMVTWQARDTLSDRGFELNYLNPIAFYRPIEFAQGSADNVLLALTWRWLATERSTLHGQILVDEFLLREVRAQSGWWANKFGGQLGWKLEPSDAGISLQTEVNVVRPFTYTHGSVLQNYGHLSQSLAHPMGTNFLEWVSLFKWERDNWAISAQYLWAIYGRDRDGDNYGGNIYRSYKSPLRTHFNYLAQGLKSTFHFAALHGEYLLLPKINTRLTASYAFRFEGNELQTTREHIVWIGLKRGMLSTYRDF